MAARQRRGRDRVHAPLVNRQGPLSQESPKLLNGAFGLGVNVLGPIEWDSNTSTIDYDFDTTLVDVFAIFGGRVDSLRSYRLQFAGAGSAGTLVTNPSIGALITSQSGNLNLDKPFIMPVATSTQTSAAWVEFNVAQGRWEGRRHTSGTIAVLETFDTTRFPSSLSPWGIAMTPSTFAHSVGLTTLSRAGGNVVRGTANSSTLTTISTGSALVAHQPMGERSTGQIRWAANDQVNAFVNNGDTALADGPPPRVWPEKRGRAAATRFFWLPILTTVRRSGA